MRIEGVESLNVKEEKPLSASPQAPASARPGAGRLKAAERWRDRIEAAITGLLLGGGMLAVVYTVVVRHVAPAYTPYYTSEITVYLVMWAVLLACGSVTHSRAHIKADLVTQLMSPRLRHWSEIAGNVAGFGFALFLIWFGGLVAYEAWFFGDLSATALRFPLWIYYAALPVSGVLIAVGHLRVSIELILSGPDETRIEEK